MTFQGTVILNPNQDYPTDSVSIQIKRIWIKIILNFQNHGY